MHLRLAVVALVLLTVARFDVPSLSLPRLRQADVEIVGTVESVASARRDAVTTDWTIRVTVERVERGAVDVGSVVDVAAWTRRPTGNPDSIGHRSSFRGTNGLPERGDRVRVFARTQAGGALHALLPNGIEPAAPLVVLVAADDEYRSELILPHLATLLARGGAHRTHVIAAADPETREPDPSSKTANTGLEPLARAHVAVLYLRYSRDVALADALDAFTRDGRPVVGLRTATHAFAFGKDDARGALDAGFGERVFGTPWRWHHGHGTGTHLLPPDGAAAAHPILRGVTDALAERARVPSWLYVVEPLPDDVTVLLHGETDEAAAAEHPQRRQPILCIREGMPGGPARMAYTSLGHPGDFEHPAVRRLVLQMVLWALGEDDAIPEGGVDVGAPDEWVAPPTR